MKERKEKNIERGKRLENLLKSKFVNLNQAAKALGIVYASLSPYLNGEKGIGDKTIERLLTIGLNRENIDFIMYGDDGKDGIDLNTVNSGNTNSQSIGNITNTNTGGTSELLIKNLLEQIGELKRERDSWRGQCLKLTEQLNLRGRDGSNKSSKNRERDYNKRE